MCFKINNTPKYIFVNIYFPKYKTGPLGEEDGFSAEDQKCEYFETFVPFRPAGSCTRHLVMGSTFSWCSFLLVYLCLHTNNGGLRQRINHWAQLVALDVVYPSRHKL